MGEEAGAQSPHLLWVNWKDHILSFRKAEEGEFEVLEFPSQQAKLEYVVSKFSTGFRIQ